MFTRPGIFCVRGRRGISHSQVRFCDFEENTLPTDIDRSISKRTEQPRLNKRNGKDDSKLIIFLTSPILSHWYIPRQYPMKYIHWIIFPYPCKMFIFHTIWVNYNISLTWIKAIWGWFPLLTIIPSEGEQWGRYNLPRYHIAWVISHVPIVHITQPLDSNRYMVY